jgi:hypothetical protein
MTHQSSQTADDKAIGFFRDLARLKQPPASPRPAYNRLSGMTLGALFGLTFGLSTQSANSILSPSIPFTHYPFGFAGNCLAALVGGAIIGLLCAWPRSGTNGVILGSLAIVLLLELRAWFIRAVPLVLFMKTILAPFVLVATSLAIAMALPIMFLLRWSIDVQGEEAHQPIWSWRRIKPPLIVMGLALLAGGICVYPPIVRQAMNSMNLLIQQGLNASATVDLPSALRSDQVEDFLVYANPAYTLETSDDTRILQELRLNPEQDLVIILARFRGGWVLACGFETGNDQPLRCQSYKPPGAPGVFDLRANY